MSKYAIELEDKATAGAKAATSAIKELSSALKELKGVLDETDKNAKKTSSAFDIFAKKADPAAKATSVFEGAVGNLGAALNPTTLAITAIGVAAAAATAVIAGVAVGMFSLGKAAIDVSQKREQLLSTFDALTDGAGKKTLGALKDLSKELPFTTGELTAWGKGLADGGGDAEKTAKAVRSVASAVAIMGQEAGGKASDLLGKLDALGDIGQNVKLDRKMMVALGDVGISAEELAKQLGKPKEQLGSLSLSADEMSAAVQGALIRVGKGPLESMALTWESISKKIAGVGDFFGDMKDVVKPFMTEVKSLFGEFSKGSDLVDGAKDVLTSVFRELFPIATRVIRGIHLGFIEAAIVALDFATAIAPGVNKLRELWSEHDGSGKTIELLKGAAVIAGVLAVPLVLAGTALAMIGVGLAAMGAAGVFVLSLVGRAALAFGEMATAAVTSGMDLARGFVDGIKRGAEWVITAVTELGSSATNALKRALLSHSPSRRTMVVGEDTSIGYAMGVEQETPRAERAAQRLGERSANAVATPFTPRAAGGGSLTINVGGFSLTVQGADKASLLEVTEAAVANLFERAALSQGLGATT